MSDREDDGERCRLVVCADTSTRKKRPQMIVDRRWNGRPYIQRPKDRDTLTWKAWKDLEE